jgi:biofilm protein TabA
MIVDKKESLEKYRSVYKHIGEAIDYIAKHDFSELAVGKNEVSENLYIVKNAGEKKSDFEGVLEVHRDWIDIHIPLTDDEIIAFKDLGECSFIEKEYDAENDYMLYNEDDISQLTLAKGYACIIDTTKCHMAMLGEGHMVKLIFKVRN